jgi:pimeloyl-ACP methyl ester carboxylesterase
MPSAAVNGINLHYDDFGSGDVIILITGSGGTGRLWEPSQVPVLTAAGYRVITVDNRGVPPTDRCPEGFTITDMVDDTAGLIESLKVGPCRVVGYSLGALIVQELLLAYPGLVSQAVLMATRGRTDALQYAAAVAEQELLDKGIVLPAKYDAVIRAMHFLSPQIRNDEQQLRDWLDLFEMSRPDLALRRAHQDLDLIGNRLEDYRKIRCQCLVMGFQDDLIAPPQMGREVAEHIPDCRYEEIPGCGHYGYLENAEAVNSSMIAFFAAQG